jgi:Rne/Rng family ribonuclease
MIPGQPGTYGISKRLSDDERKRLRKILDEIKPADAGLIVRTAAEGASADELHRDMRRLMAQWDEISRKAAKSRPPVLLHQEPDLAIRVIREEFNKEYRGVVIDDPDLYAEVLRYVEAITPELADRVELYDEELPIFERFHVHEQLHKALDRKVWLPSGGSIIIERTEALTVIDVNTAKNVGRSNLEETVFANNLEAAEEVARQLRLRDIGGLVVVDFIDMRAAKSQRKVEKTLKDALKADKARATVGRISPNGLLEINRQRIQQAIQLRTHRACPTCAGTGRLASEEMVTLSLLRRIEARAASGAIQGVKIGLHPELADAMQNSRRRELAALEEEFEICIQIIAAPGLHRPEEEIEWVRREGPPPKPKHQRQEKPAPPTLRPWDLALPEPEEEDEEEEEVTEERGGRQAAGPAEETAAEARKRKRRRGGRKRKKGGVGANGAESHAPDEAPVQAHDEPQDFEAAGDEAFAAIPFGEPEGADEGDEFEPAEAGAEQAAGGGGPVRRGRRRRRRRGGGGGKGQQGGGGE